jgi:hypothetical protein
MATVSPVPIALGFVLALGAFSALLWWLIVDTQQRPVRWPEPVAYGVPRPISHTRVAVIGVLFVVWSIWSTARPVSGWR